MKKLWSRFFSAPQRPSALPRKPTALLLEPDPITSGLLGEALRAEQLHVVPVRTAAEAALFVRRGQADLVLLNSKSNPSLARAIQEMRALAGPEDLTIIAVADPEEPESATALIAAGASDCLRQPLALSEVRSRVRARLQARGRSSRETKTAIEPGTVLDNRFRLEEELGRGNFGTVYAALHLHLHHRVAIKILHDKFSGREEVERRLTREGFSACQISHPNAVQVFDLCLTRRGEPYLVMELLQGRSLEDELAGAPGGRLEPKRAAEILIPVCRVLAESHRLGMLHLDIKPGNIFLHEQSGRSTVKVLDFGIVRMVANEDSDSSHPVVNTRSFEGTPIYASLERLLREPFGTKADVYSVGVVLYETLTGRRPYQSRSPIHLINQVMDGKFKQPREVAPGVPAALNDLCVRCLDREPATRPTAEELADALQLWTESATVAETARETETFAAGDVPIGNVS